MEIGNRVRTIDGYVTGKITEDWGDRVVIEDDDAETYDSLLEFRKLDLEIID